MSSHVGAVFQPALSAFIQFVHEEGERAMERATAARRKARLEMPPIPAWRKLLLEQIKDPFANPLRESLRNPIHNPMAHIDYLA